MPWEELKKKDEEELEKIKKHQAFEQSIISYTDRFISNFTPEVNPTVDKRIRLICITVILILLYNMITNFRTLIIAIKDFRFSPTATILEFIPFFFVPIGVYYFWKRQNFWWIIIAAWLTFTCLSIIGSFLFEQQYSDSSGFFSLFYQKHNITYFLFPFLLYSGFLIYINLPVIKKEFRLKPDTQFATIGLTIVLSILLLLIALAWVLFHNRV